jgi:putative NADPH-quinone reductase
VTEHIQELLTSGLLAVVHPNCWGAPPAMMKEWIDRVFASQVAYTFPKGEDTGDEPIGLLATRAALVLNTGTTLPDRGTRAFRRSAGAHVATMYSRLLRGA